MLLSVVIVNYKVARLAEQTVRSLLGAVRSLPSCEILLVDNASRDGSAEYLERTFADDPIVHVLVAPSNLGFSRGNELAIQQARGEYLLLLNPDTIICERTLLEAIHFLEDHPSAGAVGPRLINISGGFHPESMRGLPTLWNSFCRLSHLYRLAPTSRWLNGYYQGHRDADQIQQVPILSGACLLMRRMVYLAAGGFDPEYFMYGEDVDLCYSIEQKGYKNYYLPLPVLHYKGESEHSSRRAHYYRSFYGAMKIFRRKHASRTFFTRLTSPLVSIAIDLQMYWAIWRGQRGVSKKTTTPAPPKDLCPITIDELVARNSVDLPPEGAELLLTLTPSDCDSLLECMLRLQSRGYIYHFRWSPEGGIISPRGIHTPPSSTEF